MSDINKQNFSALLDDIETHYQLEDNDQEIKDKLYLDFFSEFKEFPAELLKKQFIQDFKHNPQFYKYLDKWNTSLNFGFLIVGPAGCGKTHAMRTLLHKTVWELSDKKINPFNNIIWENIDNLNTKIKRDLIDEDGKYFRKLTKVKFLFIDDICAVKYSDWSLEKLYNLLDQRSNFRLPTFFSSNKDFQKIKEELGERIFSRIMSLAVCIQLEGKDRRRDLHKERLDFFNV